MKYRIMQIGDKFAAQIVAYDGKPGDYIDIDIENKNNSMSMSMSMSIMKWDQARHVMKYCLCDSIEQAKSVGERYCNFFNTLSIATAAAEKSLMEATEVYDAKGD